MYENFIPSCLFNFIYGIGFAISFGIIRFNKDFAD